MKLDKYNVTKCQYGCEALVKEIDMETSESAA